MLSLPENEGGYLHQQRVEKQQWTDRNAIRVMPTTRKEIHDGIRRDGGGRTELATALLALLLRYFLR